MMKTTGRVTWCCAALLLTLTSVSAVQRLNSIDDLKKITFGHSVPTHSLVLLYWFANTVDIDRNGIRLTFDPSNGDYSSHQYHNSERLLNQLPRGQQHYTIGNLNQDTSVPLPSYVLHTPYLNEAGNRDRIIIRVNGQRIDQVYITQHYDHQGTNYDPDYTYHITTNLLRQIRQFSLEANNERLWDIRNRFGSVADVFQIRNTWGDLACLGLFLFIVTTTYYNQPSSRPENRQPTRNRGSGSNYTSAPQNDNLCLWRCLGLSIVIIIIIIGLILLIVFLSR